MTRLIEHALKEFEIAGWMNENGEFLDSMQNDICNNILELLKVFSDQGHSGGSAYYCLDIFSKLGRFQNLTPLTGNDDEWNCINDERTNNVPIYQNKRSSHVFKQADRFEGKAYDIDGKIFWEWSTDGDDFYKSYFTSSDSFVPIEFPYTPSSVYVFRPTEEFPNEVL